MLSSSLLTGRTDDKVGAAVSMACTTGCPVVFIGTGQTCVQLLSSNRNLADADPQL